jgi:hypothetical protein
MTEEKKDNIFVSCCMRPDAKLASDQYIYDFTKVFKRDYAITIANLEFPPGGFNIMVNNKCVASFMEPIDACFVFNSGKEDVKFELITSAAKSEKPIIKFDIYKNSEGPHKSAYFIIT